MGKGLRLLENSATRPISSMTCAMDAPQPRCSGSRFGDIAVNQSCWFCGASALPSVERDRQIAKFWLQPVSLAKNKGFRKHEVDRITRLVLQYEEMFVEAWHDYFNP